jgi:hypothetical protein
MPKIITEEELEKKAREEGVKNPKLFATFMKERFPEERYWSYVEEWIGRFKTGSPQGYMDKKSLKVYEQLKKAV